MSVEYSFCADGLNCSFAVPWCAFAREERTRNNLYDSIRLQWVGKPNYRIPELKLPKPMINVSQNINSKRSFTGDL
jgi:hypothetical protein